MKMLNHVYHPKMEDLLQIENPLVYKTHKQYHHHFVLENKLSRIIYLQD
jgi:hypothetical protein